MKTQKPKYILIAIVSSALFIIALSFLSSLIFSKEPIPAFFTSLVSKETLFLKIIIVLIAIYIGISKFKESMIIEDALRSSEEMYKRIMKQSPQVVELYNKEGLQIEVNRSYEELWGFPASTTLNKFNILQSKEVEDTGLIEYINKAYSGEIAKVPEYTFNPKGETESGGFGRIRWLSTRIYPLKLTNGLVSHIVITHEDITDKKYAELKIEEALKEKKVLLMELYHRTKNNMQLIRSMLFLKRAFLDNKEVIDIFKETENKIHSMALVHQKLYNSKDLSSINVKEYIEELVDYILSTFEIDEKSVKTTCKITSLNILIDIAIPLGIIINELVTNSLKYAFSEKENSEINIELKKYDKGNIKIVFRDSGPGLPKGFDVKEQKSLGLFTIIKIVEDQLQGSITFTNDNGLCCKISFNDSIYLNRIQK